MKSLAEFYGTAVKRGEIGIEIEVEGSGPLPVINEKTWKSTEDQSLRGHSIEYVSSAPIPASIVGTSLDFLKKKLEKAPVVESFRTSVHFHKNMLKYSPMQIWNAITVYWILEDVLMNYCGPSRINSTFCGRLRDAEGVVDAVQYDLSLDYPFKSFKHNDTIRYSGCNLAALRKFGTIEFRGMRGTLDTDVLKRWIGELNSLVDTAADEFHSPEDVLDQFFESKPDVFARRFLSANFAQELFDIDKKWKDTIQNGAERVLPIAYTHDWDRWAKLMEEGLQKKIYQGTIGDDRDPFAPPRAMRNQGRWGLAVDQPALNLAGQHINIQFVDDQNED